MTKPSLLPEQALLDRVTTSRHPCLGRLRFTPPHGEASPVRAGRNGGFCPKGQTPRPRASARGAGFTSQVSLAFTIVEILVVVALVVLLALIGAINALRTRMTGNEDVTLANLRQLAVALQTYHSVNNAYAYPLGALSSATPAYMPDSLTGGSAGNGNQNLNGYKYQYTWESNFDYEIVVDPVVSGVTGGRSFFVDETGAIRHCFGTGASVADPTIEQPPVPC